MKNKIIIVIIVSVILVGLFTIFNNNKMINNNEVNKSDNVLSSENIKSKDDVVIINNNIIQNEDLIDKFIKKSTLYKCRKSRTYY